MAKKGEIKKYSIVDELEKKDKTLLNDPSILGMSMLTYPTYVNSMRTTMFTAHLKQFLNLLQVDFPKVFTNTENMVGKNSSGYKKAKHDLFVYKKVSKYEKLLEKPLYYYLFVYDKTKKEFDVIERKPFESLTENFGYDYINDEIDSIAEKDIIKEGDVIYKSTSYDEDLNYGFGRNVTTAYVLDPYTSEDACVISRSMQEKFASIETDTIDIGLNNNDYLINLYGDEKHYKPFPDIGEKTDHVLAVSRRQFNNQLLFDFKSDSLKEIHDGDNVYYIDDNVEIIDFIIYNNNEEILDTPFTHQINKYLRAQNKYYREIFNTCVEIMESGEKYTRDIDYLYKRAQEFLDSQRRWREGDSTFSNMLIKVVVRRKAPLAVGCKLTGRFGNKSVVSEIREDEDMPYTKDGRRIDILESILAIVNRTTAFPLFEMFINGAGYQVRQKMKTLETFEEKEKMLFEFINVFNEVQYKKFYSVYKKYSKKKKEEFVQSTIDDGFYIHIDSLGETTPVFYRCINCLEKFDFLQEDDLYVKKWGREIKILTKFWVGEQYYMKLKQSDRRGFSARSTGAIDSKSLPTRSFKSKAHLEQKSSSCIRFGEFETLNFSIGIISEDIALFHALYRTSIKGRRDIISAMFYDDSDENSVHEIDDSYTSRVAEVFNIVLHSLGMSVDFVDEDDEIGIVSDNRVSSHMLDGKAYVCTDYQFFLIKTMYNIRESILDQYMVITKTELDKMIRDVLENKGLYDGYVKKDLLALLSDSDDDKIEESAIKIGEAVNEMEGITDTPNKVTKKKVLNTSKSKTIKTSTSKKPATSKKSTTKVTTSKAKTSKVVNKKETVATKIKKVLTKK